MPQRKSPRIRTHWTALAGTTVLMMAAAVGVAQDKTPRMAKSVMTTIPVDILPEETVSRHPAVEILAEDSDLWFAKNVVYRRDVWCLEFRFKPVRFIWVDLPQPDGKLKKTLVWYVIYSVTNTGETVHPVADTSQDFEYTEVDAIKHAFTTEKVAEPITFAPHFILAANDLNPKQAYSDMLIPAAIGPITLREGKYHDFKPFATSESISRTPIGPDETVWGVATWASPDPRIDDFSIYVTGLSNAYKWSDKQPGEAGAYALGDPLNTGRVYQRKVLKLNFWRPGDEFDQKESEIRYGKPGAVDYEWIYR